MFDTMRIWFAAIVARARDEAGMTTAELLGNAALGMVAIWAVLQTLGLDVVDWIRSQLQV
jgi:hypothetical protein